MDKEQREKTKNEIIKSIETILDIERKKGILGYRIINLDNGKYLRFNGKPSDETIAFVNDFRRAYVFKSRIHALPVMAGLSCNFDLKPIVAKRIPVTNKS